MPEVPPGTADLLIKFVPPETLERFGGARKYADAVNTSLTTLGELLREPRSLRDQQRALQPAILEPPVLGTIDLHQFAEAIAPN